MPRKSAAALAMVRVDGRPEKLKPRPDAPAEVKAIFKEIVASVAPEHFYPSDSYLIERYSEAIALARRAYTELSTSGPVADGKPSLWLVALEKAHRSSVALAARLRLSPQHRYNPKVAGRERRQGPMPWADDDEMEPWSDGYAKHYRKGKP